MSGAAAAARVGFVSPRGADRELATRLLTDAGLNVQAHGSLVDLAPSLGERVGCLVLVEEALSPAEIPVLGEALARLPTWADLPLVVIAADTGRVGDVIADVFPASGNVALLGRPLSPHTLISAVTVALRAWSRQRQVGELMAQREAAVRQRDEFLAMLAHELRNPLAPMRNALHILDRVTRGDERARRCAEILGRQVDHMVRLVDDLLDVARLERGKVVLRKLPAELGELLAAAVQNCESIANERGHTIDIRLRDQPLVVNVDEVRLDQIVCNLVHNAAKFTTPPSTIVVEAWREDGTACVAVQDRGIGFEPLQASHLFDPFLQVDPTLARNAGGLGLGLTIVQRLAQMHDGSVQAFSAGLGHGARFVVRLPLAAGSAPLHAGLPPIAAGAERRSVVVVDDNPDIRDTMETLLGLWGHECVSVGDGTAAVELVLRRMPDIALIDIGLPGLSGYDVARRIRQRAPGSGIRLIAVTGYGLPEDQERALRAGFDAHLLKPIQPELLAHMLAAPPAASRTTEAVPAAMPDDSLSA